MAQTAFNDKRNFASGDDPDIVIGRGDPRKDGSGFHPGSHNRAHGTKGELMLTLMPHQIRGVRVLGLSLRREN
jgi:hypothetical protein